RNAEAVPGLPGQVEQDKAQLRGIDVQPKRITPRRFDLVDDARRPHPGSYPAGLADQPGGHEALADVRERLHRQPRAPDQVAATGAGEAKVQIQFKYMVDLGLVRPSSSEGRASMRY